MNAAHTKKLVEDFPHLYHYVTYRPQKGEMPVPMAFGFECGDGWFPLIYALSAKIARLDPDCTAAQVKDKFGGLRFYINGTRSDKVFPLIDEAEKDSYEICEECGEPGKPNAEGWIQTLCPECRRKKKHREVLRLRSLRKKAWKEGTA